MVLSPISTIYRTRGVARVVECLTRKHQALCSNPATEKRKKPTYKLGTVAQAYHLRTWETEAGSYKFEASLYYTVSSESP
jgi:hypothetical protein